MSATFIQSTFVQSIVDTAVTTPGINTTAGTLLVAFAARDVAIALPADCITDSRGNVWELIWSDFSNTKLFGSGALYATINIAGTFGHTFTFTLGSVSGLALGVLEYSGVASPIVFETAHTDNASGIYGNGGIAVTPHLSPSLTATGGTLLIGAATVSHGNTVVSAPLFFTQDYVAATGGGFAMGILFCHAISSVAQAYEFRADSSNLVGSTESIGVAAFRGTNIVAVQTVGAQGAAVASLTTAAMTTTSGNGLVAVVTLRTLSISGSPVTDSYGNTWALAWVQNGSPVSSRAACYYALNIVGGAGHTVTFTPSGAQHCAMGVIEASGIDIVSALDTTASAVSTRTGSTNPTPMSSGSTAVLSQAEELLVAGNGDWGGGQYYAVVPGLDWTDLIALSSYGTTKEGLVLSARYAPVDGSYDFGIQNGVGGSTAWEAVGITSFALSVEPPPVAPTFNTIQIRRMRRTPHLNQLHKRITYSSFELLAQVGEGLLSGQGSDPQICLRWSDDGGRTWSREHWTRLGKIGEYRTRVLWRRLGQARDRVFEISVSDPVDVALITAYLDANVGTS